MVPADHKWFTHLIVVEAMVAALEGLDLKVPCMPAAEVAALQEARETLEAGVSMFFLEKKNQKSFVRGELR